MKNEMLQQNCWNFKTKKSGNVASTARCLAVLLGLTYAASAVAQTTNDDFDVTVTASESQQQIVTQGPTSLNGASIALRTLERISAFSRARLVSSRYKKKPAQEAASRSIMVAALGKALFAPLLDEDDSSEVGSGFSRFGTFGDITYGFGDHDSTSNTPAYDTDILSVTAGVDYRVSAVAVIGGAVAYSNSGNDFSRSAGSLDIDSFSIASFGSWYWSDTGYIDGILRYARNDYDSRRRDTAGSVASGDTTGDEFSLSFGTGYDYALRGWTVGPTARINYTNLSIDSYRERGSAEALAYDSQSVKSLNTNVGAQVSRAISTNYGVILPQGNVEWVHEFEDDGRRIGTRTTSGGGSFIVPVDARDSNFARLSVGASLLFANGRMLFLRYEGEFGREDVSQHTLSLGARMEF